jgi:glyoxylase-like metal-dependent hydrolase (beta-lactamase superfamily II)
MSSTSPPKSSNSALNRRSFLARSAAIAAVPAVATLAGGALAEPASADTLPDYAPIPPSALGPAVNAQGYFVGPVEKNLYWVTDGTYQAAFLTTREGVVLFDAPPSIGANLQRAIDQIASANGVSNKVTHIVYSHHHADHLGASSLFGRDVVRVGHAETKVLLARANDPARPVPDVTFQTHRTLHVGRERIDLAWHGTNHTPDNIYIHFPDHHTLMLVDVILPGWVPYDSFNLNEDIPGSIAAPATAMAYPWTHFIGGHMGRLGTRDDMAVYQQYVTDLIDNIKIALGAVDRPRSSPGTGTTPGPRSRRTRTRRSPTRPRRSSRSTPASSPPPTSTRPAPRSTSSSRSASTSASARRSTRDGSRSGSCYGWPQSPSELPEPPSRARWYRRLALQRRRGSPTALPVPGRVRAVNGARTSCRALPRSGGSPGSGDDQSPACWQT